MSPAPYGRTAEPRKGMAMASLIIGILSILTLSCFGVGALTGLVLGIVALLRANKEPSVFGGKGMAIGGIVTSSLAVLMIPVAGIIAAIAIPSLLRARVSANESATIGDIRTVISAQAAYQSANSGLYEGRLECLHAPTSGCIPNYPANAPTFIDSELASAAVKSGYRRSFEPGPAPATVDPGMMSPTSVTSFAYVAVPVQPGQTGLRSFCGDSTGMVCSTAGGAAPRTSEGACDLSSCNPIF